MSDRDIDRIIEEMQIVRQDEQAIKLHRRIVNYMVIVLVAVSMCFTAFTYNKLEANSVVAAAARAKTLSVVECTAQETQQRFDVVNAHWPIPKKDCPYVKPSSGVIVTNPLP